MKTVALYLRVSTGEQTVENQRRELLAVCKRRGWRVVAEFCDNGVSGAKGRDKRPGFDRLHKAITRREFDIVAAWSVDRLGRSFRDLVTFRGELHGAGVDLYLDRQGVDTSTPAGKALFQMLGVFAEFERSIIQERIAAGIARAREGYQERKGLRPAGARGGRARGARGRDGHSAGGAAGGHGERDSGLDRGGDAGTLTISRIAFRVEKGAFGRSFRFCSAGSTKPKGTARAEKSLTNQTTCRCGQWGVSVMTEEEARLHAEGIAHGMGITVYVIRSHEGDYLLAQTPSDDCEIVERVAPPGHKSAFDRE